MNKEKEAVIYCPQSLTCVAGLLLFLQRILMSIDTSHRRELWFSKCLHLRNPWNDNKEVKICRDGQV